MNRTNRSALSVLGRPAFLGIVTCALAAIAGWIAYHAQDGLPWQRYYRVTIQVADADRLVKNDDVKIGGVRVGQVSDIEARREVDGRVIARVSLQLDRDASPLPVDTRVQVRPASVLGASFVAVEPGRATAHVPDGGTLPQSAALRNPVELTDLFDVFDRATSRSIREGVTSLGDGMAGRGLAVNDTIASLAPALPWLADVAETVASPTTRLSPFIGAYRRVLSATADVRQQLATLLSNGGATFAALNANAPALARLLSTAPGAEQDATIALQRLRPGLAGLRRVIHDLTPAAAVLRPTLRVTSVAMHTGVAPLRKFPGLSDDLDQAFTRLSPLVRDRNTNGALRKLRDLTIPTLSVLKPIAAAQLHCNALGLYGEGMGSTWSSVGVGDGPSMPTALVTTLGADNEIFQNARPSANLGYNPEPHEDASECESGNEPWNGRQALGNPAGDQSRSTKTTSPPPGVRDLARRAGLLEEPPAR
jgi:phospholipid/cholesterol/gamma-HCH transport system substrate-binding protein